MHKNEKPSPVKPLDNDSYFKLAPFEVLSDRRGLAQNLLQQELTVRDNDTDDFDTQTKDDENVNENIEREDLIAIKQKYQLMRNISQIKQKLMDSQSLKSP